VDQEQTMTTPTNARTRRQVLTAGAAGAATAFLAACTQARKKAHAKPGTSGAPTSTTTVTPTVPTVKPLPAAIEADQTALRTATSLELVIADAYDTYGPKLESAQWKALASSYSAAHTAAAAIFKTGTKPASAQVDEPNKYVQENTIDPLSDMLTSDNAILDLFHDLESMLTATYITAAGTFTSADWRQRIMSYGGAAARRTGVMDQRGEGGLPDGGLYPLTDLVSNDAYIPLHKPKAAS
jgi:hypothetical protein